MFVSKFSYPVDNDQFEEIIRQGKVYVDKTDYAYNLVNSHKVVFLTRPRRFGKSLFCNTLHAYFDGKKELFKGLKIAEMEQKWEKYPVFHFIMSGLKNCTISEARSTLESFIRDYEAVYGCDPKDETPGSRFRRLIHNAYKQTGQQVVICGIQPEGCGFIRWHRGLRFGVQYTLLGRKYPNAFALSKWLPQHCFL